MKEKETPQLPVSEQEVQIQTPSFLDKLKIYKWKILAIFLGSFILGVGVFTTYKLKQKQIQLTTSEGKILCKEPKPEVCTMECVTNPPYICGSDGKSYCSICQACADPKVEWYIIQDKPCETK